MVGNEYVAAAPCIIKPSRFGVSSYAVSSSILCPMTPSICAAGTSAFNCCGATTHAAASTNPATITFAFENFNCISPVYLTMSFLSCAQSTQFISNQKMPFLSMLFSSISSYHCKHNTYILYAKHNHNLHKKTRDHWPDPFADNPEYL